MDYFLSEEINKGITEAVCVFFSDFSFFKFLPIIPKLIFQVDGAPWWLPVKGANWKNPEGPGSNLINR